MSYVGIMCYDFPNLNPYKYVFKKQYNQIEYLCL